MRRIVNVFAVLALTAMSFGQQSQPAPAAQGTAPAEAPATAKQKSKKAKPGNTAQQPAANPQQAAAPAEEKPAEDKTFKAIEWRQLGPFRGGRVLAVSGVVGDPHTYYFGGVAGGVWKTTDGGLNWHPISDKEKFSSVGSIAVSESDPNTIYVGSGEACIRGNIVAGNGVYKSIDAGKTWKRIGLEDTQSIGAVIVHPKNPDIAFVAAMGHVYGTNADRGVFRTTDGGKTWQKVLYKDEKTGAIDVVFDPGNPNTLYAALWEAHRTPWTMESGGPGSGLYKSTDGGSTWKQLQGNGLPKGILGRIGVTVSGANSNRVWALIEAKDGGLYRSDDGGDHWQLLNSDNRFRQRAWYYTHVFADPKNADSVYILNTGMYRSNDGGKDFTPIPAPHGDQHGLWIDPQNPKRMVNGNDGGADVTVNGGETWTTQYNQPTAQFYHVATDNRFPFWVYGAQQDNSTVAIASRSDNGTIDQHNWYEVGGCESGYVAPDPRDANIVYAGCYGGHFTRLDLRNGQEQDITPWPEDPMGHGAADLKYRFQWTSPMVFSPNDPNTLYLAAQVLFKTTDGGMHWTQISPDLTRNDKTKQQASGGPLTKDNTSVEYYDVIFSVAESPKKPGMIWAGTDDGLVQLTEDGGQHWNNVTPKAMPEWGRVSLIEASPHDANKAYVAVEKHELDDWKPYVFETKDAGKTWTNIAGNIPVGDIVRAVREDTTRPGLLYAGTESGVYVSWDDGANWQRMQLNMPFTPVHDLAVKDNSLAVATHGRAFWLIDDLAPIREWSADVKNADVHLFAPAVAWRGIAGGGFGGRGGAAASNPPAGAWIFYELKNALEKPDEKKDEKAAAAPASAAEQKPAEGKPDANEKSKQPRITLEILDAQGKVIRKFPAKEAEGGGEGEGRRGGAKLSGEQGMNRFIWDLRYEEAARVPNSPIWGGGTEGPQAVPGKYQVRLTVDGKQYTQPFEVKEDPRVKTTQADLEKQFELEMQVHNKLDETHKTVNQIREFRKQIEAENKQSEGSAQHESIVNAGKDLDKKMTAVEEELIQTKSKAPQDPLNFPIRLNNRLAVLASVIESADTAPTAQSYEVFQQLSQQVDAQLAKWKDIVAKDVPAYNDLVKNANIPALKAGGGK